MAMPDGVEALLTLAAAPRERLTRTAYNVAAFNPSAEEIRGVVLAAFPRAQHHVGHRREAPAHSSIPGPPMSTTARPAATGASRRATTLRRRSATI